MEIPMTSSPSIRRSPRRHGDLGYLPSIPKSPQSAPRAVSDTFVDAPGSKHPKSKVNETVGKPNKNSADGNTHLASPNCLTKASKPLSDEGAYYLKPIENVQHFENKSNRSSNINNAKSDSFEIQHCQLNYQPNDNFPDHSKNDKNPMGKENADPLPNNGTEFISRDSQSDSMDGDSDMDCSNENSNLDSSELADEEHFELGFDDYGLNAQDEIREGQRRNERVRKTKSVEGIRLSYGDDENDNVDYGAENDEMIGLEETQIDAAEIDDEEDRTMALNGNATNGTGENDDDDEDDDEYDDDSECSGGTVVANDYAKDHPPPPADASREELNRYYWEWCYGPMPPPSVDSGGKVGNVGDGSWSATRLAPGKSCLSVKKTRIEAGVANNTSLTPSLVRRIHHPSPSFNIETIDESKLSTPTDDATPIGAGSLNVKNRNTKNHSTVKFGTNHAAEFDFEQPITEMTPIPASIVQQIFPTNTVETEKEIEEQGFSRETAKNVALLAEWDDDFDSILSQDDSDDEEVVKDTRRSSHSMRAPPKRGKKRTPLKNGRRSSASRPQKSRRESSIFSRERRSLIDDSEDESNCGLPLSVAIDPVEYTSPSSVPSDISAAGNSELDETISTIGTPGIPRTNEQTRESLDSACVSPSSLKSDSNSSALESSGKETPNSARTSSSTILRAVHASGAFLPSSSPQAAGGLKPNQLKYSPSSSSGTERSVMSMLSSSPSDCDSQSLGSDIMSLFSQHNIDDSDSTILWKQLSLLRRHGHLSQVGIGDLLLWLTSTQKESSDFIQNHLLKSLGSLGATNLVKENIDNDSMFVGDSKWLQSALFKYCDKSFAQTTLAHRHFESILLNEAMDATKDPLQLRADFERSSVSTDGDFLTTTECIKELHEISSFEWASIEIDIAERSHNKLQDWSETADDNETSNCKQFVGSCYSKLIEASNMTMEELSRSAAFKSLSTKKMMKSRKRKALRQMENEMKSIQFLEDSLTVEVERLNKCKRAKKIFRAYLDLERSSPISALSEEVRAFISPTPVTINGSDFTFTFLDGAAEVAMKLSLDEGENKSVEIGCFIKDGGASTKLIQAFLLGNIETAMDGVPGPYPLRESLMSLIVNENQEVMFIEATQLFFKIETLVRSVKKLESQSFCSVSSDPNGNALLSVSMHQDGDVVQTTFSFDNLLGPNWFVATVPNDIKVEVVSSEDRVRTGIESELEHQAKDELVNSSSCDPTLLQRICGDIMSGLKT